MTTERKAGICGICPSGCGVIVTLKDGQLEDIKADTTNAQGGLCIRGKAAKEIVYSPDRLTAPLIRTGQRGEGKFRQATWDEALDKIANSMLEIKNKYGPQAMTYYYGRGVFEQTFMENYKDWLFPFGSPNLSGDGSLCAYSSYVFAPFPTLGINGRHLQPDTEHSNVIVIWGQNPLTSSPPYVNNKILKAKKRGVKIIVIDHMLSSVAKIADEWIPVRSGTDGALALGMIRTIINEDLHDHEFVEKWTFGFEELKKYVQQFTPANVERITGVSATKVEQLARDIALTRKISLYQFTGLEYADSGVQNIRALNILWSITGNIDEPGGMLIKKPAFTTARKTAFPRPAVKPFGAEEYPLFYDYTGEAQFVKFPDAVILSRPYPVKGLIIHGAATLANYPQPERYIQAYKQLELLVVIDRFPVADTAYADVVLPATTYFEIKSYRCHQDFLRIRERMIEPQGQSKNDCLIISELAERLGYGHLYPKTEDEILEKAFGTEKDLYTKLKRSPEGLNFGKTNHDYRKWETGHLRPDGKPGFNTPSGKIEIWSSILEKYGYDALPVYKHPSESPLGNPELAREYPLVLNTGARTSNAYHSQHLNIPRLLRLQKKPMAIINKLDAEKRGIKQGDKIKVKTTRGQVYFWASVGERVPPGEIEVNKGGGQPFQTPEWREANVNYLTDLDNCDPISGFPVVKALLCEIEKSD